MCGKWLLIMQIRKASEVDNERLGQGRPQRMTVQTKHFIELSDIVAIRFACKRCGASLSLALSDSKLATGKGAVNNFIDRCPSCSHDWFDLRGSSYEQVVVEATVALNHLSDLLSGQMAPNLGASLVLEIKAEAIPGERK